MKNTLKLLYGLCMTFLPVFAFGAGNYQAQLKKLNDFFKTFDNGYYGYFEVKDGYLYDRFSSGKYTKTRMEDLGDVTEAEANRKVTISCKNEGSCVYSTYTNSYHAILQYSQDKNFDTDELIALFNNFINAYNGKSTTSETKPGIGYQTQLKKLNDYLKTFDNGYYGYFEVKDGYLFGRFPSGKYTKTPIEDLGQPSESEVSRKVTIPCKDGDKCVYSTYTDSYHVELSFSQSSDFDTDELISILENFINALQGNSSSSSSTQSSAHTARLQNQKERINPNSGVATYTKQLNALNAYLKTFNSETYGEVSVTDGKVYFYFKVSNLSYYSYIPIGELLQNTTVAKLSDEVKIGCKGTSKCFYSSYTKSYTDHFRFFSNTVSDLTKMKLLVDDFLDALN